MAVEDLYYGAPWSDGAGTFGNGHWILAAYTGAGHDDIIVNRSADADMYAASVRVGMGAPVAYLEGRSPSATGDLVFGHPSGSSANAWDWEDNVGRHGFFTPKLWFEHDVTFAVWLPPEIDQIKLALGGTATGNVERGLWYRSLSYVAPPYTPPPPPVLYDCPPRPEWPYQQPTIATTYGPRGVLRGARSRR